MGMVSWMRKILLIFVVAGVAGCGGGSWGGNVKRSPDLVEHGPPPGGQASGPNAFTKMGDATWNVVSAPARWVAPKKKVAQEPETFEPADAVIIVPGGGGQAATRPGE